MYYFMKNTIPKKSLTKANLYYRCNNPIRESAGQGEERTNRRSQAGAGFTDQGRYSGYKILVLQRDACVMPITGRCLSVWFPLRPIISVSSRISFLVMSIISEFPQNQHEKRKPMQDRSDHP